MRTIVRVLAFSSLLASPAVALADSYGEAIFGMGVPISDDDYNDAVEESVKLGVRLGSIGASGGGPEFAFDFTPVNYEVDSVLGFDLDAERYRIQLGGRFVKQVNRTAQVFARAAVGVDIVTYSATGTFLGTTIERSETDAGIAAELAAGFSVDLGKVSFGGQLGLPMAFHFEDDDPNDDDDADLDYTGIDIDLLLAVTAEL